MYYIWGYLVVIALLAFKANDYFTTIIENQKRMKSDLKSLHARIIELDPDSILTYKGNSNDYFTTIIENQERMKSDVKRLHDRINELD